jgi:hypothetical protein
MDPLFNALVSDSDESASESDEAVEAVPRRYMRRFDFDVLSEIEVVATFRLRRQTILMLEARVHDDIRPANANYQTNLTPLLKLLIAIR